MSESQAVAGGRRTFVHDSALKIAGVLYVVAVFQFFVFELVAETLYPGYSVASNYISDLGATCVNPPSVLHCVVHQPTARIFDTTVFLLGLMLLAGAFFVYHGTRKKLYFFTSAVADIAILLAGVLPESTGWPHAIVSVVLFWFLGISLVLAWTIGRGDVISYLAVTLGALTLVFNVSDVLARVVGVGGQERLLVFCALLGLLSVGGYLTGQDSPRPLVRSPGPLKVKSWTLAAITVTATMIGLVAIAIAIGFVVPQAHIEIPEIMVILLPNLILLLLVTSIILWLVTAARWRARR